MIIAAVITATGTVIAAVVGGWFSTKSHSASGAPDSSCKGDRMEISAPSKVGGVFDMHVDVHCAPKADHTYKLIAELHGVGTKGTEHNIYCPRMDIDPAVDSRTYRMDISTSPVNSVRTLYVISVDPSQSRQLGENTVTDDCRESLPKDADTVSNTIQVARNY
ncbi:hypothetical protein [Streptomyces sp. NPDC051994]|uniref:hypothetical protein n=1 Tax=unclassified Streptomyces TaxID=2593676 RepID=UPI00341598BE